MGCVTNKYVKKKKKKKKRGGKATPSQNINTVGHNHKIWFRNCWSKNWLIWGSKNTTMSEYQGGCKHVAVRLNSSIVVIGGRNRYYQTMPLSVIWTYNLYTEQWRKHQIPHEVNDVPNELEDTCAAAIGADIYLFGGSIYKSTNEMWKLTGTTQECLNWSKLEPQQDVKLPCPRFGHSGWEYAQCLWVFGGKGLFSSEYLSDHGDISQMYTNQLLCYDPSTQKWTNPQCFGSVPYPRMYHSTTVIRDKTWLFGGITSVSHTGSDLFELDMRSCTWTEIRTGQTKPSKRFGSSLTAISDRHLVLHAGMSRRPSMTLYDTWIFDLQTQAWTQYTSHRDHTRSLHTGTVGINKAIIIIGGYNINRGYTPTFHVILEPKSLQQLAMKIIYNKQDVLPWKCLPSKLIAQLNLSRNEKSNLELAEEEQCK